MAKKCKDCSLHEKCLGDTNLIYGSSQSNKPKYLIILDYATKQDIRNESVPSGDVDLKIQYLLQKAGIKRNEVAVTAAIKCPIDAKKTSKIKNEHLEACAQYLMSEIEEYKPSVLIPAGKIAFQMLSGFTSVSEFVGHDYDFKYQENTGTAEYPKLVSKKIKTFPMYSPNASLFLWKLDNRNIMALKKAKLFVETGKVIRSKKPEVRVVLSLDDLKEFENEMMSLKRSATDFETEGLRFDLHEIICSGYSVSSTKAWVVFHSTYKKSFTKKWNNEEIKLGIKINKFVKEHHTEIIACLKRVHDSHIEWELHHGKFDQKFAMQNNIPFRYFAWCSMAADSLIDENEGHSLNEVYVRNGINYGAYDVKLYPYVGKKDQKNYKHIPPQKMITYLGYDVCGVHEVVPIQKAQLAELNLLDHMLKRKMPTINEVLIPMEFKGVKYDKELLLASAKNMQERISKTLEKLRMLTNNKEFNPNSDMQISAYLQKKKFPFIKYEIPETTRGFSTNADSIKKISSHEKFKAFGVLLSNYKKLGKIQNTYISGQTGDKGMLQFLDKNNFVHANYNMHTPVTSRYSCRAPSLQVFPRPIEGVVNTRQFIQRSDENLILFEFDYTALEQYIVAIESRDDVLISKILDGTDIHAFNATTLGKALGWIADNITYEMFLKNCGKDPKFPNFKKDDPATYKVFDALRTKAKTVGFGLNYGKGAETFAKEFGLPVAEVELMIETYFRLYKKMAAWREKIITQATEKGILKLRSGRLRRFTMATDWIRSPQGRKSWSARIVKESIARMAMNFPIQGGAHEAFETGCLKLVRNIKKKGLKARLMMSNHDGGLGECPPEEKEILRKLIPESMEKIYNEGTPFELSTKIDVGFYEDRWYGKEIT